MSDNMPYADIVILALIAGFILLRLRSVLGSRIGSERPTYTPPADSAQENKDKSNVQLIEKQQRQRQQEQEEEQALIAGIKDTGVTGGLDAIRQADPAFSARRFVDGAKVAYEMVFEAFVKSDKNTLRSLLSKDLLDHFLSEIDKRTTGETRTETTLVSVESQQIVAASLTGKVARISVHFVSEQISVVRNSKGEITEGDPSHVERVEDQWVFERDISSRNPNWQIVET